uniref:Fibronectin type-III domain-containing protein n=1 Tax=Timema bartmani TaxID=61472 RepID=A0A7R9EWB3_9NEOP|nr:unnamed protein product [Timema bartmani]
MKRLVIVQNDFWKCLVLFPVIQTISKCAARAVCCLSKHQQQKGKAINHYQQYCPVHNFPELSVTTPKLNLKAVNATKDSLTVTWDVTSSPASRFQVCWGIKLLGEFPEDCANATELPGEHVIKELSPCQWYTVSVEARDENSDPLVTEEIVYFTDGGNSEPPGVSESLQLGIRSNEIGALWKERGEHNGTCIYSFTLCWKKIDGLEEGCRVSLTNQELIIIKDLEYCTNYTVTTYTSSIEGLKSTNKTWHQFTGPGEIENLTLTSLGPDSIAVKWEPPTKGWSCSRLVNIISYTENQNIQNVTVSLNETEYVFHNLESCNNQHFFIRVISEDGDTSRPIMRDGYTAANAPGQVEDFKVFETKSHGLHVTWSPPSENEQCLFKYSVCWRETGKTQQRCERQGLGLYPKHSIYGLQSCTEYIVTVASMGSTKIIGNTTGLTVFTGPEPVTALKVDNVDTRSVTVSWESPTCAQQFSVCWGAWQDKGGHSCTSVTNTSYTVSGLEPGNNYTIIVAALGNTGAQSDVRIVTASVAKEPPKELVVKNYTGDSVTVVWSVSLDQPTTELARVCWKLSNDYGDGTCSNTAFSGQEYTISDLEPCHWYRFTIFTPGDEEKEYASVEQFTDDFNNEQPRGVKNLSTAYLDYNSFRVKWDNINGSCASHLLVCWEQSQVKGNGCQLIQSYRTSFSKGDLNVCTNVTVSVSAVSVDGLSSGNESITITTAPGRVQNLTSWVVELGSIGLKWDPPLPGEDCVSHYIVGTENERFHVKSTNVTEGKLEHILSNLTHCKVQLLFIQAANQQNAVSERSYKRNTSGAEAPGEVTEPKVAQTGSHSLHLEWKRPLELFDCLVMYSVCWKETNGTDSACAEQKLEQYPKHNLYGLKSCTEYTVTLATLGVGKLHDNDTTLTQFTEPLKELVVKNYTRDSVTVVWSVSLDQPTTELARVCWKLANDYGDGTCSDTSFSGQEYTISDLEPCHWYRFTIFTPGDEEKAYTSVEQFTDNFNTQPPPNASRPFSKHSTEYHEGSVWGHQRSIPRVTGLVYLDELLFFSMNWFSLLRIDGLITELCFTINRTKSILEPIKSLVYLGFNINFKTKTLTLTEEAKRKATLYARHIVRASDKDIERIAGYVAWIALNLQWPGYIFDYIGNQHNLNGGGHYGYVLEESRMEPTSHQNMGGEHGGLTGKSLVFNNTKLVLLQLWAMNLSRSTQLDVFWIAIEFNPSDVASLREDPDIIGIMREFEVSDV